ncbi:MAG: alpha/beta fold hydrolase [Candidatus Ranarchaeia archaeon]|jgi:pimeloyl-ACP methyl ester carboxylesterase
MSKSQNKNQSPILCLHGFGVRGWFFDPIRKRFSEMRPISTPDLYERTIAGRLDQAIEVLNTIFTSSNNKAIVVGHSLGGVIGSILASKYPKKIAGLLLLATPYDGREGNRISIGIQKFLVKRQLIPDKLAMGLFFSNITPKENQKAFFEKVVPEPPALIDEIFLPVLPHVKVLSKIKIPTLCMGSRDDKTVSFQQMEKLSLAIPNATMWLTDHLNHSELLHGPESATSHVFERIGDFFHSPSK